ncbi:hypothetical protein Q8F55_006511 [Vanrija albida]|uniref:Fork-head domain-containing protein n=1 Tax=Vanrija albida TaxID=181172 RepID=A0ABR3PXF2_9TREE
MSEPSSARHSPKDKSPVAAAPAAAEPVIDPELADLPPPPHHSNGAASSSANAAAINRDTPYPPRQPGDPMGITESIASAPNPHHAEFSPLPFTQDSSIDVTALDDAADNAPGSPNARLLRAIAPPNAAQPNPNWPPPPPNASVNLFIGRALLSNGNDNWPLKPNDIVNWIRKHYPDEWDGDEGRCSAHRVRTYLARKGADMYYEKLNQGCIAGWRIRQNHLWRFEGGGFQGRGMKQEEAIAAQQKENELMATAAHKAAAAAALAQGHPSVKVSMSTSGLDGPPNKRLRKTNGQARRKSEKKKLDEDEYGYQAAYAQQYAHLPAEGSAEAGFDASLDASTSAAAAAAAAAAAVASVEEQAASIAAAEVAPVAEAFAEEAAPAGESNLDDASLVQQAMAAATAAAGQIDELDMGLDIPVEMQMHTDTHDHDGNDGYHQYGQVFGGSYQQGQ